MEKQGKARTPPSRVPWRYYFVQSLFATLAVFVVFIFLSLQHAVIIASLGSTVFIVFAMPNSITANPRNVVGGHLVGLAAGSLCSLIPHSTFLPATVVYAFAVGLSIFLMVVTDTEHPPASGTALGVVTAGFSLNVTIAVISSAIVLSLIHVSLKSRLKDLT
jgi:CBS-domain-containing membrane protein